MTHLALTLTPLTEIGGELDYLQSTKSSGKKVIAIISFSLV